MCILLQYGLTKTKINPFSWHLHGKCQNGLTKTSINPLCFLLQYGLTKTKINPLLVMRMSLRAMDGAAV